MAALKASEIKYGIPLKTSVGDLFLTATTIEFPASATYEPETATQNLELNLTKLGLTGGNVAGLASAAAAEGLTSAAGEVATTSGLALFAWATPLMVTGKLANEANKVATASFLTYVGVTESKLQLRLIGAPGTAAVGKPLLEGTNAGAAAVGNGVCTVFVLGK